MGVAAAETPMEYRPLGRTGLSVSAVGFGTAQLRRVTEARAIDTLRRGFELGVKVVHRFNEPDGSRRTLLRTLLQQELLKRGVLTFRGFLLPSLAHGEAELDQTATAYEAALCRVRDVAAGNAFERELEIPPVV